MSEVNQADSIDRPETFHVVSDCGSSELLRDLQNQAIRSLFNSTHISRQSEVENPELDHLLAQDEIYRPIIRDLVKPSGFYGSFISLDLTLTELEHDSIARYMTSRAAKFGRGILMHVAIEATSTSVREAGRFSSDILYFQRSADLRDYQLIPSSPKFIDPAKFPVARKVVGRPTWEEGSAFLDVMKSSKKLSRSTIRTRQSNGKTRRLPKS